VSIAHADPGKRIRQERERNLERELEQAHQAERQASELQALLEERERAPGDVAQAVADRRSRLRESWPELIPAAEAAWAKRLEIEPAQRIAAVDASLASWGLASPAAAAERRLELLREALEGYRRASAARSVVPHQEASNGIERVAGLLEEL
jgi:hypothetical protein